MNKLVLSRLLERIRRAAGYTQDELANLIAPGGNLRSKVNQWENGKWGGKRETGFPLDYLRRIIESLFGTPALKTLEDVIELVEAAGYHRQWLDEWWPDFLAARPHLRSVMASPWPPVPPDWRLPRPELAVRLRAALLGLGEATRSVVIYGPAGAGKRTLLDLLKEDAELTAAFPDGVLTAELGRDGNVLSWQTLWAEAAGAPLADYAHNPQARRLRLQKILHRGRWLLLIAEVYSVEAAELLLAGGPRCAAVLTTPNRAVFDALARYLPDGQQFKVDGLNWDEAQALWQKNGRADALSSEELAWLHTYVRGNAFALTGAFALVRQHGLAYVREALEQASSSPLPDDVEQHVFRVLQVAHRLLSAEARVALERLAEFPRVRLYTLPPLLALWECSRPFAERWLIELADYGLVTLIHTANGRLLGCALHEQTYRFVRHLAIQRGVCVTTAERLWSAWLERYFASPAGQAEQAELRRRLKAVGLSKCLWLLRTAVSRQHLSWRQILGDIWRHSRGDMEFLLDMPEMTLAEWCLAVWLRREGIELERLAPRRVFIVGLVSTLLKFVPNPIGWIIAGGDWTTVGTVIGGGFCLLLHMQSWLKLLTAVFAPLLEQQLAID